MTALPMSRFKVLDLTRARAGPTAVRQMADMGADVIKIEDPGESDGRSVTAGDRHGFDFQNLHRNKRSLTLNLKKPEGHEVFMKLVAQADVVIENYRPGVKDRLGINYDACRAVNPRIVYGSISGFGQSGPYRDRPGVDQIAQGMGGLMSVTGLPGQGPVRVGVPIADLSAGLYLAVGVLTALLEREVSGEGQWVHTSLLEAQLAMLDFQVPRWTMGGEVPPQAGNNHPTGVPTGVFETSDGHINIAASGGVMFERMANCLGAPDMPSKPQYKTNTDRQQHRDELNEEIATYTRTNTSEYWVAAMNEAGVPCGPIHSVDQACADEQVQHLGFVVPVEHPQIGEINIARHATNLERTPHQMRNATPEQGEHTDAILADLGYTADQIADLHAKRVV